MPTPSKRFDDHYFNDGLRGGCCNYPTTDFHYVADQLRKHFNFQNHLDLGSGFGLLVQTLRELGIDSSGIEVSDYAYKNTPENIKLFICHADLVETLHSEETNSIDLLTAFGVLDLCDSIDSVIPNCYRILKSGSSFILTVTTESHSDLYRHQLHSKEFWITKFLKAGFAHNLTLSQTMASVAFRPKPVTASSKLLSYFPWSLTKSLINKYYLCLVLQK